MSAVLAWLYEGGAKNCGDCRLTKAACASGGRVRDLRKDTPGAPASHLCPSRANAPRSLEGQVILSLAASGAILKTGFGGVEGIDRREARARLTDIHPPMPGWIAAELLDYAENGILKGVAARRANKEGVHD